MSGVSDVVASRAEAAALDVPPLVVLEGLAPWVPGSGEISVRRIGDGHSNETFRVDRGDGCWILRRPPRPPVPPSAHDVRREHALLSALHALGARVPRPVVLCDDERAIGAPFFLMELVDGVVVLDRLPPAFDDPAGCRAVCEQFVDGLVELHAIDWRGSALERIGRPHGYLERQLRRWQSQWEHNRTRPLPALEEVARRLAADPPVTRETTVVHGDYKLNNILFSTTAPVRRLATIDWELATLGDPLADLGFLLATYVAPGDVVDPVLGFSAATGGEGGLSRAQLVERYAAGSGRSVARAEWYECLALWKLAVLFEGSWKRHLAGTTVDPFFVLLEEGVPRLAERALALSDRGGV
ncbi:phosphotransferase family protein [Conexibacter sp. CPCC 206217]|uniref:phosphotransferase family protein n=1 Tax=Conexibacter sp. CPCC 206217 TaxID=3064574 RepID=UPI002723E0BF|nr:phosphotransferase family protein [Conexibacter sp. CPCC 206217]MDO8211125.1 phosphotransferase family protein [Conexibacter sp. CPCC 206217]